MNWIWIVLIVYGVLLLVVCLRIIYETHSSTKATAYLMLCIFLPVFGIAFYMAFGINYWRTRIYSGKLRNDEELMLQCKEYLSPSAVIEKLPEEEDNNELAALLMRTLHSPVTTYNNVKLLLNGEEKFAELIAALKQAKHHIHLEYYIFEQDDIGSAIIEVLIAKAKEGVEVRFIYDDFGSPGIKRKIEKKMRDAGIEIFPFSKVHFYLLANRINYRNHRKIVVIDGQTGFTGGINVSDKYINDNNKKNKMYWRDTHLRIDGPGVFYLQYLFLSDWNFCCGKDLNPSNTYFDQQIRSEENKLVQIVGSGPDAHLPSILFAVMQAIYLAKKQILITTPYFIPGDNILDALRIAAASGLDVKMLVPGKSDSKFVNAASKANYHDLLKAGVEIYVYQKGFVHAKTIVTDGKLSMIGSANVDHRSFKLNFEVNAIVYDSAFAKRMVDVFFDDLKDAEKIDAEAWYKRPLINKLPENIARLFSPVM